MRINDRIIGTGNPVYVIAEIGVNHNGNLDLAHRLIDVAVAAGADSVKFQTFQTASLVSPDAQKADYQKRNAPGQETQASMLSALELSAEAHHALMRHCSASGIDFLSTPFDLDSADLLDTMGVPAFKISSGDLTNPFLLAHVAKKRKPMILSTGMASLADVEAAVALVEEAGIDEIALLHCVSSYPAPPEACNLRAMATLSSAFGRPVGWSDHTEGSAISIAAAALGASIIEKHLTMDRKMPGPDHLASMEPREFGDLIVGIRQAASALGDGRKQIMPCEENTAEVAKRSLVAAVDIPKGTTLEPRMCAALRPATGLSPFLSDLVLGRVARDHIDPGTQLDPSMFMPR